jgi:pyruvate ferredoxin oxidoreductase alpha subunit
MSRRLLTGNAAAAWGARLARADYVPAFPITPQTEIIETLAEWIARGESPARLVILESEHAMITAAGAAAATGVRVFTATSSQGLLYGSAPASRRVRRSPCSAAGPIRISATSRTWRQ